MGNQRLDDQLETEEAVAECTYDADTNQLHVVHHGGYGYNVSVGEITAIRQGKLTPSSFKDDVIVYDVHITLGEQEQARASKFSFSA